MPDLDDLLRRPRPAQGPGHRRRVGAEDGGLRLRPPLRPRVGEGRGPVRDGDDREAGRLGRARQHHAGRAHRRRRVRAPRPQVVLLGADVRRLPGARPGRGRPDLLRPPALPPRRQPQRLPPAAPEGQARQPLQRLQRGRVPRRLGPAPGRGGPRRAHDHRDGRTHPAGLRDRRRGRHARRGRAGHLADRPPLRLRQAAGRPAADAQRARRPRARVRGGDGHGDATGPRLRRRHPGRVQAHRHRGGQVLAVQARCPPHRRGAGVLRRQRLRGGVGHAAALPRGPAQRHLGGLGQRHLARRPARPGQDARDV